MGQNKCHNWFYVATVRFVTGLSVTEICNSTVLAGFCIIWRAFVLISDSFHSSRARCMLCQVADFQSVTAMDSQCPAVEFACAGLK